MPCDYPSDFQTTILRDRFICGLMEESIQKRLLTESNNLMFNKAVDIAVGIERASLQVKQIKTDDKPQVLFYLKTHPRHPYDVHDHSHSHASPTCYRCLLADSYWRNADHVEK